MHIHHRRAGERLLAAILLAVLLVPATPARAQPAASAPFDGSWWECRTTRGVGVCEGTFTAQNGARVCGVSKDMSSNYDHSERFVATANGSQARIERICGTIGATLRCAGQAPDGSPNIGWSPSDRSLLVCNGRLRGVGPGEAASCAGGRRNAGLPRAGSSRVREDVLSAEDRAWLDACAAGRD